MHTRNRPISIGSHLANMQPLEQTCNNSKTKQIEGKPALLCSFGRRKKICTTSKRERDKLREGGGENQKEQKSVLAIFNWKETVSEELGKKKFFCTNKGIEREKP